ncbi:MAG: GNAT family N-acetyltransferase [Clostridiales bacterium]|nr:GNAT family N-acetyltransferase [Clostridiales bacterium]
MIRQAQVQDHVQLKEMWTQVFGDEPQAVEAYFALRHRDEDMLVWAEGNRIDGMLSMLPVTLVQGGEALSARYIYAVATSEARRGRGIATFLLEWAGEMSKERGEAAHLLVPASESLFGYYEKRGFRTAFALNVMDVEGTQLAVCPAEGLIEPCSAKEYVRIRDHAFERNSLYARWDESAVKYALAALGDGGAARLAIKGGEGVACWSRTDEGVLVRELALVGMEVELALALLHRFIGADRYRVRLAAEAQAKPYGMIRWFEERPPLAGPGYLALSLD